MARAIIKKRLLWASAIAVAAVVLVIVLVRIEGPKASPIATRAAAAQLDLAFYHGSGVLSRRGNRVIQGFF